MKNYRKLFGNELRTCREARSMTQIQECDLMGNIITDATLSRYERGECLPPDLDMVLQLAEAIGCLPSETKRLKMLYFLAVNMPFGTVTLVITFKEFALWI